VLRLEKPQQLCLGTPCTTTQVISRAQSRQTAYRHGYIGGNRGAIKQLNLNLTVDDRTPKIAGLLLASISNANLLTPV